ncbi:MAG: class I SAM-dependent methyltransferase [Nitrospirae bacterium]|nr:class I SAM-dependent methyltransferase [Nitrospirota bacterium]
MGIYSDHILPRIIDKVMSREELSVQRRDSLKGLSGEILEVGFGSGLNLPYYPKEVIKILALEPSMTGKRLAQKRIASCNIAIEFVGLTGEEIPLDDSSVDAVLTSWSLCTIPDPHKALLEMKRVLRPNGVYHFTEHGLSDIQSITKWQDFFNPIHKMIAGGCHINRPIKDLILNAGFNIRKLENFYMEGSKIMTYTYKGIAFK